MARRAADLLAKDRVTRIDPADGGDGAKIQPGRWRCLWMSGCCASGCGSAAWGRRSSPRAIPRRTRTAEGAAADRRPAGRLICNVGDNRFIDDAHDLIGVVAAPVLLDEKSLIVRDTFLRRPLFALADRLGQKRVHVLIVGFGDLGRAVMEACGLDRHCRSARQAARHDRRQRRRRMRGALDLLYPRLDLVADVEIVALDLPRQSLEPAVAIDREPPAPLAGPGECRSLHGDCALPAHGRTQCRVRAALSPSSPPLRSVGRRHVRAHAFAASSGGAPGPRRGTVGRARAHGRSPPAAIVG